MPDWPQDTPWRQGRFLTPSALTEVGGIDTPADEVAVVVSHDCDLAQQPDKEPDVEVVFGKRIASLNGTLSNAKSTRSLHLSASAGAEVIYVELDATRKRAIPKERFGSSEPRNDWLFDPKELAILQRWLARRYRRAAFPTNFNDRLTTGKAATKIADRVKPCGKAIRAIYFDVDGGLDIEKTDSEDLYSLAITVVYDGEDAVENEKVASALCDKIEQILRNTFFDAEAQSWKLIELAYCDHISDAAVTISQSMVMKEWNLDHVSLRDQDQQPLPPE